MNDLEGRDAKGAARLSALIGRKAWAELRGELRRLEAPDVAAVLPELGKQERVLALRMLERTTASEVFAHLEPGQRDRLLRELTDEDTRRILAELSPDDRTEILSEMPGAVTQRLLNLLGPADLAEARLLLGYPPESVGRLMRPDYVAVRPEWSVGRALEHLRSRGSDSETLNRIYVTDASWKLLDGLDLRRFILADPAATVERIMDRVVQSVPAFADREEAVRVIQRYDLVALPVVDSAGVLLGIVTVDDVMDVAEAEATEDIQLGAAVAPLRASYRESGVWSLYLRRVVWVVALLALNLASAGVIAAYERVLATTISLTFFLPILMGSGGNVGTQSATLIVRAMAVGELDRGSWLWALAREGAVGLLLGVTLGALGWALGLLRGGGRLAAVAGAAMVVIVVTTNLVGAVVPFLLTRLRIDPAVASSPLIASISDVTCLTIYFAIAAALLGA